MEPEISISYNFHVSQNILLIFFNHLKMLKPWGTWNGSVSYVSDSWFRLRSWSHGSRVWALHLWSLVGILLLLLSLSLPLPCLNSLPLKTNKQKNLKNKLNINVITFLSLWVIQKQAAGGIWPADQSQQSWSRLMPYHCLANTLSLPCSLSQK